jgi:hypothetical protein
MAIKTTIVDPSPRAGVFEGDLKYGRCEGTRFNKHSDFSSGREERGTVVNKPAAPLVLQSKRDPEVWRGKTKHPKIKENSSSFAHEVMLSLMKFSKFNNTLPAQIRVVKIGKKEYIREGV